MLRFGDFGDLSEPTLVSHGGIAPIPFEQPALTLATLRKPAYMNGLHVVKLTEVLSQHLLGHNC